MMIKYLVISIWGILLYSCSSNDNIDGPTTDSIKLSTNEIKINKNESVETITTGGNWWWFSSIKTDNSEIQYDENDVVINGDWYTVTKVTNTSFKINVEENTTNMKREFTLTLRAGNYFDSLILIQE
ncbi:BACON domain-containing protein [Dysgonomonas sp. ZJ709]|uniref:BACON domain-containing protein n=1 Tax=Dysgonomonas sp. ZJ709 TaxID=2709797 RepID=UPI0013EBCE53|nr:BACON domain-containing protein [Dysgonomonas sp. ZJ709]